MYSRFLPAAVTVDLLHVLLHDVFFILFMLYLSRKLKEETVWTSTLSDSEWSKNGYVISYGAMFKASSSHGSLCVQYKPNSY